MDIPPHSFWQYLSGLSPRDRTFYLTMHSYQVESSKANSTDKKHIDNIFQSELTRLLAPRPIPVSSLPGDLTKIDKQLDEKFGAWEQSSLSSEETDPASEEDEE
jgi:hypothetical protein